MKGRTERVRGGGEKIEAAGIGRGGKRGCRDSGELLNHGSEIGGVGGEDGGGSPP